MVFTDCLVLVAVAFITAGLTELASHYAVYRSESRQKAIRQVNRVSKQLDAKRAELGSMGYAANPKKKERAEKALAHLEKELKTYGAELTFSKLKSGVIASVMILFSCWSIGDMYGGKPVIQLPFEPIFPFRMLTHRGLEGENYKVGSMAFVIVVSSSVFRAAMQKVAGTELPRALTS
ncbi:unnamed protein product, partial [Chrysoparadoxa australica]